MLRNIEGGFYLLDKFSIMPLKDFLCLDLNLAFRAHHSHRVAQRGRGVVEFGGAMGAEMTPPRMAVEIDAAAHGGEVQFVDRLACFAYRFSTVCRSIS